MTGSLAMAPTGAGGGPALQASAPPQPHTEEVLRNLPAPGGGRTEAGSCSDRPWRGTAGASHQGPTGRGGGGGGAEPTLFHAQEEDGVGAGATPGSMAVNPR